MHKRKYNNGLIALFIDNQINKAKRESLIRLIVSILVVSIVIFTYYYIIANNEQIDDITNFYKLNLFHL